MGKKLTISISEYDEDVKNLIVPALQGGKDVTFKKYSTLSDLGDYTGDDIYPLILVGHANGLSFKTGIGLGDRVDGQAVAEKLLSKNLKASTFPFCLIAGCSGAADKTKGLYITIAKALGIPVVASSTVVSIGRPAEDITLTPQNSGTWRVYFPKFEEYCDLYGPARTEFIRDVLDKQEFKCKLGVV
jgi:hypothetical protein